MNITVYCGSNPGNSPIYEQAAEALGKWIGSHHHRLIYGGGDVGLMRTISRAVMANGGEVTGFMPKFLLQREDGNDAITDFEVVPDFATRKTKMAELGDAFIALPGGPGTLEEIADIISWVRVGLYDAPCILYNVNRYYDALYGMYQHMVSEGFIEAADIDRLVLADDLEAMIAALSDSE